MQGVAASTNGGPEHVTDVTLAGKRKEPEKTGIDKHAKHQALPSTAFEPKRKSKSNMWDWIRKVEVPKYGLLHMMAHSSMGQIGALNALSFCERINSCSKDIMRDLHTCLSNKSIEKAVMLKMNAKFMNYMWTHYAHEFARSYVNEAD